MMPSDPSPFGRYFRRRRLPDPRSAITEGERPPVVDYEDAEQPTGKPLAIDTMERPLKPPGRGK